MSVKKSIVPDKVRFDLGRTLAVCNSCGYPPEPVKYKILI